MKSVVCRQRRGLGQPPVGWEACFVALRHLFESKLEASGLRGSRRPVWNGQQADEMGQLLLEGARPGSKLGWLAGWPKWGRG